MSPPREIIVTYKETWEVVTEPRDCKCGHQHYGRVRAPRDPAYWGFCEDEACPCNSLRPKET